MDIINQINTFAYPIAIPLFILLILIEIYLGWRDRNQHHELKDSSVNIASGLVFFAISLLTKSLKLLLFFMCTIILEFLRLIITIGFLG